MQLELVQGFVQYLFTVREDQSNEKVLVIQRTFEKLKEAHNDFFVWRKVWVIAESTLPAKSDW